jgi:hypothetical protein
VAVSLNTACSHRRDIVIPLFLFSTWRLWVWTSTTSNPAPANRALSSGGLKW